MSSKRTKRDTVENLYKSCKMGGDCPPDVVNKVEQTTLADTLLQIFSSIVYFGGLGFGTGKGSTGAVGARPIPEIPIVRPEVAAPTEEIPLEPIKPRTPIRTGQGRRPFSVPLDTIGAGFRPSDPSGSKAVDIIDPGSSSIVPLRESIPDTIITIGEPNLETGDSILTDIDVITDITSINSHPTVIQGPNENVAILNVTPFDPPATRVVYTLPQQDPSISLESVVGHIDPSVNIFVDPGATGENVFFGEEIPLEPLNPRLAFEIEDLPRASTPEERLQRAFNRAREFYSRHVQQVRTRNLNLLGDVRRAIEFGFENPAFEPEISVEFERDLSNLEAAPDEDFANIKSISRPYVDETPGGTVRVSRFAKRAGMRTRQGTLLTQNIHLYYDISDIPQEIEMQTFSDINESSIAVNPNAESTFINGLEEVPEDQLIDSFVEDFSDAHLLLATDEETDKIQIPILSTDTAKVFVYDFGSDIIVAEGSTSNSPFAVPKVPLFPVAPSSGITVYSDDFYLNPSLMKKRKRKRLDYF
uniref:Minor capsid protein L2 n=1 Tax=Human papillomavirus TaxID=10566 RepID=A0A3R5Z2L6_9PAPI|nr:MAG: L2 protein [Human papillomavirus]